MPFVRINHQDDRDDEYISVGSSVGIRLSLRNETATRLSIPQGIKVNNLSVCLHTSDLTSGQYRLFFRERASHDDDDEKPWLCLMNFLGKNRGGESLPASIPIKLPFVGPSIVEFKADGTLTSPTNSCFHLVGYVVAADNVNFNSVEIDKATTSSNFFSKLKRSKSAAKGIKSLTTISWALFLASVLLLFLAQFGDGGESSSVSPSLRPQNYPSTVSSSRQRNKYHTNGGEVTPMSGSKGGKTNAVQSPVFSGTSSGNPDSSTSNIYSPSSIAKDPHTITIPSDATEQSVSVSPSVSLPVSSSGSSQSDVTYFDLTLSYVYFDFAWIDQLWIDYGDSSVWRVRTNWSITNYDGDEIWSEEYEYDLDNNFTDQALYKLNIALPAGTYEFSSVGGVPFIVSSGDEKIICGYDPIDNSYNGSYTFVLPFQEGSIVSGCVPKKNLEPEEELGPVACYLGGLYNYDKYDSPNNFTSDDVWLTETCGLMLADACDSREPLGFNEESSRPDIQQFCLYQQCASEPYLTKKWEEWIACKCLLPIDLFDWYDDIPRCCNRNPSSREEPNLSAGCECYVIDWCNYDAESCFDAANYCCFEGDKMAQDNCQSEYRREACDLSIQTDSTFIVNASDCCLDGDIECFQYYSNIACESELEINATILPGSCIAALGIYLDGFDLEYGCNFWNKKCSSYPGETCEAARKFCCREDSWDDLCHCDFVNYASNSLGYESPDNSTRDCSGYTALGTEDEKDDGLLLIYKDYGGDDWFNNTGWLDDQILHCQWYGVSCNGAGKVSAIHLNGNNLNGTITHFFGGIGYLYDLEVLDVADNQLSGTVPFLYDHQKLRHVDLSGNNLHGKIEVLLSPSVEYVNVSYNNLTQVNAYKQFKRSHQTLRTLDLSHNHIGQNANDLLFDIPSNLRELILSDNLIRGTFPSSFEQLSELQVFRMENNQLSGSIPDDMRALPRLRVLNLSNQRQSTDDFGLSGSIPQSLSNLVSLSVLDLSSNRLT
jgi:hypothetical protein